MAKQDLIWVNLISLIRTTVTAREADTVLSVNDNVSGFNTASHRSSSSSSRVPAEILKQEVQEVQRSKRFDSCDRRRS